MPRSRNVPVNDLNVAPLGFSAEAVFPFGVLLADSRGIVRTRPPETQAAIQVPRPATKE